MTFWVETKGVPASTNISLIAMEHASEIQMVVFGFELKLMGLPIVNTSTKTDVPEHLRAVLDNALGGTNEAPLGETQEAYTLTEGNLRYVVGQRGCHLKYREYGVSTFPHLSIMLLRNNSEN
ncbi:hypothetical protein Moror_11099 [Moniliophthora roreri MCA 2997]|nr:hypothetical protein Moror_11099 [Moniliophthora roreri MCA 2997]